MTVTVSLRIGSKMFDLGRILALEGPAQIDLEEMVPLGQNAVPLFSVHEGTRNSFEAEVRDHPSVAAIQAVRTYDGTMLYALDWAVEHDRFFEGLFPTHSY